MSKRKRRKKTPKRKVIDQCEGLWREIIIIRDNNICQKCFKALVPGPDRHCSHVIPKARDGRLAVDTLNGKLLCFNCHLHWWHKHPVESGEWFRQEFANRWEYLEGQHVINKSLGTIPISWWRNRYEELKDELREMQ